MWQHVRLFSNLIRPRDTPARYWSVKGRHSSGVRLFVCWFVGCLTSQQHASVSQGRICSDNFTCCHIETEVADQTFYLTQSLYTDTGLTSPSADPIMTSAWQGSYWSAIFKVTCKRDSNPGSSAPEADALTTRPARRSAVDTKLAFKLVKTAGHCSTVHGKFLIVLGCLVTTTSTGTLASKGTLNL